MMKICSCDLWVCNLTSFTFYTGNIYATAHEVLLHDISGNITNNFVIGRLAS